MLKKTAQTLLVSVIAMNACYAMEKENENPKGFLRSVKNFCKIEKKEKKEREERKDTIVITELNGAIVQKKAPPVTFASVKKEKKDFRNKIRFSYFAVNNIDAVEDVKKIISRNVTELLKKDFTHNTLQKKNFVYSIPSNESLQKAVSQYNDIVINFPNEETFDNLKSKTQAIVLKNPNSEYFKEMFAYLRKNQAPFRDKIFPVDGLLIKCEGKTVSDHVVPNKNYYFHHDDYPHDNGTLTNAGVFHNQFAINLAGKCCFSYHQIASQIESYDFKVVGVYDLKGKQTLFNDKTIFEPNSLGEDGDLHQIRDHLCKNYPIDSTFFKFFNVEF